MSRFKVGDRVRIIKDNGICNMVGKYGTVRVIADQTNTCCVPIGTIGVEFDESFYYGHTLGNHCKDGYGRWYPKNYIELIDRTQPIVIYRKDREVIALDKNTGKRAVAKCSPNDEFDFNTGAKLAFKRLFDEDIEDEQIDKIKVLEQNFDILEAEIVDFKAEVLEYMKKANKDTATYLDSSMRILKLTDELHRRQEEQRVEIMRLKNKMEGWSDEE